jgi:hypothetical protein
MNRYDFLTICANSNKETATHAVLDEVERILLYKGRQALTEGQLTVYVVETFFGETCNGGLVQYLDNMSGDFANHAPACLERVGLGQFARVINKALALFPHGRAPENIYERSDEIEAIEEKHSENALDEIGELFWPLYDHEEFRNKLFAYIERNEAEFVDRC